MWYFHGSFPDEGGCIYLLAPETLNHFYRCLKRQEPPGVPDKFGFAAAQIAAAPQTKAGGVILLEGEQNLEWI